MFISNPFSELAAFIPSITPDVMQTYIILMFVFVVGGTILDMIHKKSAQYFFENSERAKKHATREVAAGEKASLLAKTIAGEVLTSSEFSNPKRRLAHILTMYGFIIFVVTTVMMIFGYTDQTTPALVAQLWHIGALMVAVGGYWFWLFIRVDVAAEGNPWYRVVRADLFILSLLATSTFALIWSAAQSADNANSSFVILSFVLFIVSSTVLFSGVLWSKFAHMFFKPAAAFQKRVTVADGSRENLPESADRTNPADSDRHSMELLKDAPLNMGLGIKREAPKHY
ncbi:MAG: adenylyl-sulfate reductase [Gammaproteobacteria bacterium]|nr:adenylyl-sulfate reductase [Gammaproteobacteria bacterium]